jgi:hypothetical protein
MLHSIFAAAIPLHISVRHAVSQLAR